MSQSRMYQVPNHLALGVSKALSEFQNHNPVASMGADERRAQLRRTLAVLQKSPLFESAITEALTRPRPPLYRDYPVSIDDAELYNAIASRRATAPASLQQATTLLLQLLRWWPRSPEDAEAFRRRTTFSAMVSQLLSEALVARGHLPTEGPRHRARRESYNDGPQ